MPTGSRLKKKDPPPKRNHPYDWAKIAEQLKAHPGEWFEVFEKDKIGYAMTIRNNGVRALRPDAGFEVRTANTTKGTYAERTCSLYLRWVKPKKVKKA